MTTPSTRTPRVRLPVLNDSMKDVKEITAKINSGKGTMGKLVNDESLYNELTDTSKNINADHQQRSIRAKGPSASW